MTTKLRIGIIGTGVGLRTHYPGFKRTNGVEFAGLVGSSYDRALTFAKQYEFKQVFHTYKELVQSDEVDLVCVTSPNTHHVDEILLAIENGKHILAEKPLASNISEIHRILNAASKSPKMHLIDHQLRFNPYIIKVKDLIKEGSIGRPYFIRIHQQSTGFADRNAKWIWSFDERLGGGVRLAMASHFIDLINFWFDGIKPLLVKGAMDSVVEERKDNANLMRNVKVSGFFSSSISFDRGLDVHLSATAAAIGIPRFDFSIYGTEGELHFDLNDKLRGAFLNNRGTINQIEVDGVTDEERDNKVSIFSGSFVYFADKIVKYFTGIEASAINRAAKFEDAVYTQVLLDAIRDSSTEGSLVRLNDGYQSNAIV
jgi:predicted dehydrogenase